MELDMVQPIRTSILILKLFGLWSLDSGYSLFYKIYMYLLHASTTLLTTAMMWISVVTAKNVDQFTDPLFMALTMIGLTVKVVNILNLNAVAVNYIKLLKGNDFVVQGPDEFKVLKNSLRSFYRVVSIYTTACFAVIISGFATVTLGTKRNLPYPTWFPVDYKCNSTNYWLAYGYQFGGMIVACLSNASLDMLHCYFMHSASLIYCVLGHRMASIGQNLNDVSNSDDLNSGVVEELKEIIKVHNFAKKLTIDCERLLSIPIFVQVLLSAFVLCFTGFRLTTISPLDSPGQFFEMIDFLFVMALQIYLPCHYGNEITVEASKLNNSLYSSNWTPLPPKSRKLIYLYMEFLKEPVYVEAGNFFPIGLTTFVKTLNNAYSFFAILIRMKK